MGDNARENTIKILKKTEEYIKSRKVIFDPTIMCIPSDARGTSTRLDLLMAIVAAHYDYFESWQWFYENVYKPIWSGNYRFMIANTIKFLKEKDVEISESELTIAINLSNQGNSLQQIIKFMEGEE